MQVAEFQQKYLIVVESEIEELRRNVYIHTYIHTYIYTHAGC